MAKRKVSELEDTVTEIIQSKQRKKITERK